MSGYRYGADTFARALRAYRLFEPPEPPPKHAPARILTTRERARWLKERDNVDHRTPRSR